MNLFTWLIVLALYFLLIRPMIGKMFGHMPTPGFVARPQSAKVYQAIYAVAATVAKADGRESSEEMNAVIRMVRTVMGNPNIPAQRIVADYRRYGSKPWQASDAVGLSLQFRQLLLDVAINVAISDWKISTAERKVIFGIGATLDFGRTEIEQLLAQVEAQVGSSEPARQTRNAVDFAYERLGLKRGASQREIKRRYQQLAMKHHPDRAKPENRDTATENFKEIGDAYRILKGQY